MYLRQPKNVPLVIPIEFEEQGFSLIHVASPFKAQACVVTSRKDLFFGR